MPIHPMGVVLERQQREQGAPSLRYLDEVRQREIAFMSGPTAPTTPYTNQQLLGTHKLRYTPPPPSGHPAAPTRCNTPHDCPICTPKRGDGQGKFDRARRQTRDYNTRVAAQHEERVRRDLADTGMAVDPWTKSVGDRASRLIVEAETRGRHLAYGDAYRLAGAQMAQERSGDYARYRATVEIG